MTAPKNTKKQKNKGTKGSCWAFFITLRPRGGLTDATVEQCRLFKNHMPLQYELFVLEKEGEARHAHWIIFPKAAQQRSNIVSQVSKWCLQAFDDDSVHKSRACCKHRSQIVIASLAGEQTQQVHDAMGVCMIGQDDFRIAIHTEATRCHVCHNRHTQQTSVGVVSHDTLMSDNG
tara:strand:- start:33 stop:557 length:525 start_codon:yes stop_codon:yes gene_type:complete